MDHFVAGRASPRTRKSYRQALEQGSAWLTAHGVPLLDANRTQVEVWVRRLEDQGYALSTIAQRLSTLSSFYRWCVIEQHLDHNPVDAIRRGLDRGGLDRDALDVRVAVDRLGDDVS